MKLRHLAAAAASTIASVVALPANADCSWDWLCNGDGVCKQMPVCDPWHNCTDKCKTDNDCMQGNFCYVAMGVCVECVLSAQCDTNYCLANHTCL